MSFIELNDTSYRVERKTSNVVEIGDVKQSNFYPQVKFLRWDNECNFSIRLKEDIEGGSHKIINDKICWSSKNKKLEVNLYDLPVSPTEGGEICCTEEGGFELETILYEKPDSNILEYTIESKELDFFYQPPLTQEEIDEGCFAPENVIGSYAVYHKTKKDNYSRIGGKNYKTGKIAHIYRPYAIDSENKRVWCELNIDEKRFGRGQQLVLTISIPQDFLNTAIYPITVDPIFGYDTCGSLSTSMPADYAYATKVVILGDITDPKSITSLSACCNVAAGSTNIKGVIWTDAIPGVIVSNAITPAVLVDTVKEFKTGTFGTSPEVTAGNYYVGIVVQATVSLYYDSDTGSFRGDNENNYGTPENLAVNISGSGKKYSVYFTWYEGFTNDPITEELHCKGSTNPDLTSDNFDDNSLGAWWTTGNSYGVYTINEQNNRLELTADGDAQAAVSQSIVGNFDVSAKLVDYGGSGGFLLSCDLMYRDGITSFYIGAVSFNGGLSWVLEWTGGSTTIPSTPFWLRMTLTDGTAKVYSSTNGTEWTERSSKSMGPSGGVDLECYVYESPDDAYVYWDDFVVTTVFSVQNMKIYPNSNGIANYLNAYVGAVRYIPLSSNLSHILATSLRVRKGGVTYAVLSERDVWE